MSNWRSEYPIFVPEANSSGGIAVIRSLGRAGYPVHACARSKDALGLRSNFALRGEVCPQYDDPALLDWVRRYLREHGIRAIVPSEDFLVGMRPMFSEIRELMAVPQDEEVLYAAFSKAYVFESFLNDPVLKDRIPPTFVADDVPTAADLEPLGRPLWVKADQCLAKTVAPGGVFPVDSVADAITTVERLLKDYTRILIQGSVPGRKATINFCIHEGKVLAESGCIAKHENPHTGGLTALRHTWWNEAVRDDALARMRHVHWEGVVMVEYRWDDTTQDFCFLEMNTRYWAALHLDLFAGMDFPRIQLDAFFGKPETVPWTCPKVTARYTIPAHFGYALSRFRDKRVSLPKRVWALTQWCLLLLHPTMKSDLLFPGDRKLYWIQWRRFLADMLFGKKMNT